MQRKPARQTRIEQSLSLENVLAVISLVWVLVLALPSELPTFYASFAATIILICVGTGVCAWRLTNRGLLTPWLACSLIPLFCVINYQLYAAFGDSHYRFDTPPNAIDWITLCVVHIFKATDVLDSIDDYGSAFGFNPMNLRNSSIPSGLLLVWMHGTCDLFLVGAATHWVTQQWLTAEVKRTFLKWFIRIYMVSAYVCVLIVLVVGIAQSWTWSMWLLWPLDNILRAIDFPDMMQIFKWRLHSVPMGIATTSLAVVFRFLCYVVIARYVGSWFDFLKTRDEWFEALDSDDIEVRRHASYALERIGITPLELTDWLRIQFHSKAGPRLNVSRFLSRDFRSPTIKFATSALVLALSDDAGELRKAAQQALKRLTHKKPPKKVCEILGDLFKRIEGRGCHHILNSVALISKSETHAVSIIINGTSHNDLAIRHKAILLFRDIPLQIWREYVEDGLTLDEACMLFGLERSTLLFQNRYDAKEKDDEVFDTVMNSLSDEMQSSAEEVKSLQKELLDLDESREDKLLKEYALQKGIDAGFVKSFKQVASLLSDWKLQHRRRADAALRLGEWEGPRLYEVIRSLATALSDRDPDVQEAAAEALRNLGDRAKSKRAKSFISELRRKNEI